MEGRNLTPDGIFAIVYGLLVPLLLLPLLAIALLLLFSSRLEIRFITMDPSEVPESSLSERDGCSDSTDSSSIHSADKTSSPTPPSPCQLVNILDSSVDDIRIPTLQPVLVHNEARVVKVCVDFPPLALLDNTLDALGTPVLVPEQVSPTAAMVAHKAAEDSQVAPWDGKIKWALKGCSIFDNSNEERDAFTYRPNLLSKRRIHDVWIFQYGVRYLPSSQETNCYRTVRIQGLPITMALSQVLPNIKGEIYSACLADTQTILGSNTAIVTFVLQTDAARLLQASKDGLDLGLVLADVIPVNTPTYPMPADMERMIFEKNHTRCLCVYNSSGSQKERVSRILAKTPHANMVEGVEDGHLVGEVYVRFYSIRAAAAACEALKAQPSLSHCRFRYLKETCALPPSPVKEESSPELDEGNACIGIWD